MVLCTAPRPAFIPAANTAQVKVQGSINGSEVMNVFYFQQAGDWTHDALLALANAVDTAWVANIANTTVDDFVLNLIDCTDMEHATGPFFRKVTSDPGLFVADTVPNNVTLSVTFRTALRGRSYRGRMYFAGIPRTKVIADHIDPAYLNDMLNDIRGFFAGIFAEVAATHVVVSYCQAHNWLANAVVTPVVAYDSDGVVDSQRRRLSGRGM